MTQPDGLSCDNNSGPTVKKVRVNVYPPNHRSIEVGRDLWGASSPTPAQRQRTQIRKLSSRILSYL